MKRKYAALRTIKWVYRIVGVLLLFGGIALGLFFAFTPSATIDYASGDLKFNGPPMLGTGFSIIVTSLVIMIILEGVAELLQVLIDTEENTRLSGMLLKQLIRNQNKSLQPILTAKDSVRNLLETDDMPEF